MSLVEPTEPAPPDPPVDQAAARDAAKRARLIEEINGVLADERRAEARIREAEAEHRKLVEEMERQREELIQKLRSETGTARAARDKARRRYHELHLRLEKLLPTVEDPAES